MRELPFPSKGHTLEEVKRQERRILYMEDRLDKSVPGWRTMTEQELADKIGDYISVVDEWILAAFFRDIYVRLDLQDNGFDGPAIINYAIFKEFE
jgi:hypothetical protein